MGLSTSRFVLAAAGVTLALLGGCAGGQSSGKVDQAHVHAGGVHVVAETPGTCPICEVYELRRDSVVRIRAGSSLGTGVVIDNKGTVLTNAHVVGDSAAVTLETYKGDMIRGVVVRRGMSIDLALISADPTDIKWQGVMPIAEDPPVVGSKVYVIGHPAGLGWTLTEGIISARRRVGEVEKTEIIQITAAVSPGNSGGPAFDGDGHWIGTVTSKLVGHGLENISFVIPASELHRFLSGGAVSRPRKP